MIVNKLKVEDGIVMDEFISDVPIYIEIIEPYGKNNVRTLIPMEDIIGVTVHDTDNYESTASDSAHSAYFNNLERADLEYVGAHFFVDHDSITQKLPINEVSYNAGDGNGDGNMRTISVEICVNKYPDKAEENAKKLICAILQLDEEYRIFKHQDWNGKNCPARILGRPYGWSTFQSDIWSCKACNKELNEVPDFYKPSWEKAVLAGVEDGYGPNETVTSAKLMAYFDKMGILDTMIESKGK